VWVSVLASALRVCFAGHVLAAELVSALSIQNMGFSVCENSQIGLFFSMCVCVLPF
jgi:hypothetical protein